MSVDRYSYDPRPAVLERDNHRCVLCGYDQRLTIHHIKPKSIEIDHRLINLAVVCEPCHTRLNRLANKIAAVVIWLLWYPMVWAARRQNARGK